MKKLLIAAALLVCVGVQAAEPSPSQTVDVALARAQREHLPLFVDFQAQWCYSCYYMATHVLNGAQWQAAQKRMLVLEADADSPDGAAWMHKLGVKALPSYVVLKPDGSELGRITAEQPREKFYPALEHILAGGDALDALKTKAGAGSIDAIAEVLTGYEARNQVDDGLAWYTTLPAPRRKLAEANAQVSFRLERLRMQHAAQADDVPACIAAADRALHGGGGCDRVYALEQMLECADKLPPPKRKSALGAKQAPLADLLKQRFFANPPQCADQRTAVLVSADLAKAIGDDAGEKAVLDRAIANARARLGENYAADRNLADNLRVYLTRAERTAEADALYPKLMAAYPDDYVYAYRYGASLLKRGKAAEALPYLEQAADKTFGANRLAVATQRVKALLALNRRGDAEKVVADALAANGPWFPEQAEKLKAALKG